MNFLRQSWFHIEEFSSTPYFAQLMVMGTLSTCLVQRLGVAAWHTDPVIAMLRSFAIAMWMSCTAAAGIIGFERRKGTLVYLLASPTHPMLAIASLVLPVASFGMLSFPLSVLIWIVPGRSSVTWAQVGSSLPLLLIGLFMVWLASVSITLVIALLFVLTPNATVYEDLLLVPLMVVSGVFVLPGASQSQESIWQSIVRHISYVFPTTGATRNLYSTVQGNISMAWLVQSILLTMIWICIATALGFWVMRKVRHDASLEVA